MNHLGPYLQCSQNPYFGGQKFTTLVGGFMVFLNMQFLYSNSRACRGNKDDLKQYMHLHFITILTGMTMVTKNFCISLSILQFDIPDFLGMKCLYYFDAHSKFLIPSDLINVDV